MVEFMMRITQDMDYEGSNFPVKELMLALKEFNEINKFSYGIDWEWQLFWANMTDEQAFAFVLKHPEYSKRFIRITENGKT